MASRREVQHVWTCDACGAVKTVDDSGAGYPVDWGQVVVGRLWDQLGNVSSKHLCGLCASNLKRLLAGNLGNVADIRQAKADALREAAESLALDEEDITNATEAMQEGEWQWFVWLMRKKLGARADRLEADS